MAVTAEQVRSGPRAHLVQFYESDPELIETVSGYLAEGIRGGQVAIVIATETHRRAFEGRLTASGVDVGAAQIANRLILLDAAKTLEQFVVDDRPDHQAFDAVIGGLIRGASKGGRSVRAFGEMVTLLWDDGQVNAAVELEAFWNDLGREIEFALFCAYPISSFGCERDAHGFDELCRLHSSVVEATTGAGPVLEASQTFAGGLGAPTAARHFVVDTLSAWGRGDIVDDAAVVVAELATNAVLHAKSEFTVAISYRHDRVRIAVRDRSRKAPALRDATAFGGSGRGLRLVGAIATRWGTKLVDDGKAVWAELG